MFCFLSDPQWLTFSFIVILSYIENEWPLIINLAINLKFKFLENFHVSMLLIEVLKCQKIVEFPKTSIKMEDHMITRPKHWAAFRESFSSSPDKSFLDLWNKHFLTYMYRNIKTFAFQRHQECCSWTSRNGAVNFFFCDQPETSMVENVYLTY